MWREEKDDSNTQPADADILALEEEEAECPPNTQVSKSKNRQEGCRPRASSQNHADI